jgi:dihydroneopterin aldolase
MATIALEGMKFYAYHGFYKEEQLIGTDYVVDVYIESNVNKAAVSDNLKETINYETIYHICEGVMRIPSKLIENVAQRISLGIKNNYGSIKEMKVRVRKMNPPLGGQVDCSYVEVDGSFTKKCGRCQRPMLCYSDSSCWCMGTRVFQKTLEQLKGEYGNRCICKECLEFFAV